MLETDASILGLGAMWPKHNWMVQCTQLPMPRVPCKQLRKYGISELEILGPVFPPIRISYRIPTHTGEAQMRQQIQYDYTSDETRFQVGDRVLVHMPQTCREGKESSVVCFMDPTESPV